MDFTWILHRVNIEFTSIWYDSRESEGRPYGHTRNTHSSSIHRSWFSAGDSLAGVLGKGVSMKVDHLMGKGNHATYKGKDVGNDRFN